MSGLKIYNNVNNSLGLLNAGVPVRSKTCLQEESKGTKISVLFALIFFK